MDREKTKVRRPRELLIVSSIIMLVLLGQVRGNYLRFFVLNQTHLGSCWIGMPNGVDTVKEGVWFTPMGALNVSEVNGIKIYGASDVSTVPGQRGNKWRDSGQFAFYHGFHGAPVWAPVCFSWINKTEYAESVSIPS